MLMLIMRISIFFVLFRNLQKNGKVSTILYKNKREEV